MKYTYLVHVIMVCKYMWIDEGCVLIYGQFSGEWITVCRNSRGG